VRVTNQAHRLADAFEESMRLNMPDLPTDQYAELAEISAPEVSGASSQQRQAADSRHP